MKNDVKKLLPQQQKGIIYQQQIKYEEVLMQLYELTKH